MADQQMTAADKIAAGLRDAIAGNVTERVQQPTAADKIAAGLRDAIAGNVTERVQQPTPRYLPVTSAEMSSLIAASGPDRPLLLGLLGKRGVALDTHGSAWAVPLLQELRHV
jgi:predicted transcriptional regulator